MHYIVAGESTGRYEVKLRKAELGDKLGEVPFDAPKDLLAESDQVHLVNHYCEVADPEQPGNDGMPVGLLQQPFMSVHQQHGQIGGGCASSHVPRILLVSGRIGDDELAPGCGEIAIGDVDRNPLLAL